MPRLIDEPEITTVDSSYYIPLASATGVKKALPGNLPYLRTSANAVTVPVYTKLLNFGVSPEDFDTSAGSGGDDYAALNKFFTAIATEKVNGLLQPKKYLTSQQLTMNYSDALNDLNGIIIQGGGGPYGSSDGPITSIKYTGTIDNTVAVFGFEAANVISMQRVIWRAIGFDAAQRAGYCFKVLPTSTLTGAVRRENEGTVFEYCQFTQATRHGVLLGIDNVDDYATYIGVARNDLNCDSWAFRSCTFLRNTVNHVRLVGANIQNNLFDQCLWITTASLSGMKNHVHAVLAYNSTLRGGFHQAIVNTGHCDGTDKVAILRQEGGNSAFEGVHTEDCRILYAPVIGTGDQVSLSRVTVNDSSRGGENAIYCASGRVSVSDSILSDNDTYPRKIIADQLNWSYSKASNLYGGVDVTLTTPEASMIGGEPILAQALNQNVDFSLWNSLVTSSPQNYELSTTGTATIARSTLHVVAGSYTAKISVTVTDGTLTGDKVPVAPYKGKSIITVVSGYTTITDTTKLAVSYLLNGGASAANQSNTIINADGTFVVWALSASLTSDALLQAKLNITTTGDVYVDTFVMQPYLYDLVSHLMRGKYPYNPLPLRCNFAASNSVGDTNVTGDGTAYVVICDTVPFDDNSNYNNGTGIATVPVSGKYVFTVTADMANLGAAHTLAEINLVTTGGTYRLWYGNAGALRDPSNELIVNGSVECMMTTGDTAKVQIIVSNSTKTVTVGTNTRFSGRYVSS